MPLCLQPATLVHLSFQTVDDLIKKINKLQKCLGTSAHLGSNQGIRVGGIFPSVAVKQDASTGKKRTLSCYCRSQLFLQPFPGLVGFGDGVQWVICTMWSKPVYCWVVLLGRERERRAREKPSSQSNLCVVSAKAGDVLFFFWCVCGTKRQQGICNWICSWGSNDRQ